MNPDGIEINSPELNEHHLTKKKRRARLLNLNLLIIFEALLKKEKISKTKLADLHEKKALSHLAVNYPTFPENQKASLSLHRERERVHRNFAPPPRISNPVARVSHVDSLKRVAARDPPKNRPPGLINI